MVRLVEHHRFTVEQYQRMGEVGILRREDKTELIDGEIVRMSPIGMRHMGVVAFLNHWFIHHVGDRSIVHTQGPLTISEAGQPEPDLAILKAREDFYVSRHPEPDDVLLLIEVAETSLQFDQTEKALLYARAGIADYWVLDLPSNRLHVYRQPTPLGYEQHDPLREGSAATPLAFPDRALPVREALLLHV